MTLTKPTQESKIHLKFDDRDVNDRLNYDSALYLFDQRLLIKIKESEYTHFSLKYIYLVDIMSQVGGFNAALWLFFVVCFRSWFSNMFLIKIGEQLSEEKPLKKGQSKEQ